VGLLYNLLQPHVRCWRCKNARLSYHLTTTPPSLMHSASEPIIINVTFITCKLLKPKTPLEVICHSLVLGMINLCNKFGVRDFGLFKLQRKEKGDQFKLSGLEMLLFNRTHTYDFLSAFHAMFRKKVVHSLLNISQLQARFLYILL